MKQQHPQQTIKSWKEISREKVFEKFGRGLERVMFQLPDGSQDEYYIKKEQPTVAVFAVTDMNDVILVEQFRPGPKKVIRELPGGFIDAGETPRQAAERELFEETGYIGSFQYLFPFHDCAYSTRVRHCFLATGCQKKSSHTYTRQKEDACIVFIPLVDFYKTIFQNPMTDVACALAALSVLSSSPFGIIKNKKPRKSRFPKEAA